MKIAYRTQKNFHKSTLVLLDSILKVVKSYQDQGYKLTLRQLYYQLVVQNIFANEQRNYAKLSSLLGEARMCGLCDWAVIEDRIRIPKFPNEWDDIHDAMDTLIEVYRRKRWNDQTNYVEVWCEKDALSGVLLPITRQFHVHLLVNRGYSSISAMYDSSSRFNYAMSKGKKCHLLYLGDHDPSGLDMIRDIDDRLSEFNVSVDVKTIAITLDQIKAYNIPHNPAKLTDSRASNYIEEYGNRSWEVDALEPKVLNMLLTDSLNLIIDKKLYGKQIDLENDDKEIMASFAEKCDEMKEEQNES